MKQTNFFFLLFKSLNWLQFVIIPISLIPSANSSHFDGRWTVCAFCSIQLRFGRIYISIDFNLKGNKYTLCARGFCLCKMNHCHEMIRALFMIWELNDLGCQKCSHYKFMVLIERWWWRWHKQAINWNTWSQRWPFHINKHKPNNCWLM